MWYQNKKIYLQFIFHQNQCQNSMMPIVSMDVMFERDFMGMKENGLTSSLCELESMIVVIKFVLFCFKQFHLIQQNLFFIFDV